MLSTQVPGYLCCMERSAQSGRFGFDGREVNLWAVRLDASGDHLARCLAWLSPEESARAARFHFDEHRRAFILAHGVLRALAGRFTAVSPSQVNFSYGPKGKPAIEDTTCSLRFNMAHSGTLAVYAFTVSCQIGIDVEQIRPVPEMADIAARFFAPDEAAELMSLPEPERAQGFFNCWTRKEAYIKAVGDGLSLPLASFRVSLQPGVPARLLCLGGDARAAKSWTLHDFTPAPDCVGALAYPDQPRQLLFRPLIGAGGLLDGL